MLDRAKKVAQIVGACATIAKAVEAAYHWWCNTQFSADKPDVYILQDGLRMFHKRIASVQLDAEEQNIEELVVLHHDFQAWWRDVPGTVRDTLLAGRSIEDFENGARLTSAH